MAPHKQPPDSHLSLIFHSFYNYLIKTVGSSPFLDALITKGTISEISFDTLKDNLNKEKLELTLEKKTNDNGYLFNSESSDSFEEFDQKNEPSSASSNSESAKSEAESSNSDDLLTSDWK